MKPRAYRYRDDEGNIDYDRYMKDLDRWADEEITRRKEEKLWGKDDA